MVKGINPEKLELYSKRKFVLCEELLLPGGNMSRVAEAWGLSRERVRQIFNKTMGASPVVVYGLLKNASDKFRCIHCGKSLPEARIRKGSKYCSEHCRKTFLEWDYKNPRVCDHCGITYFPHRNAEYVYKAEKTFCSVQCYIDSGIVGRSGYKRYLAPREVRYCLKCGKPFVCKTKQPKRYCSHECLRTRGIKKFTLKKTTP